MVRQQVKVLGFLCVPLQRALQKPSKAAEKCPFLGGESGQIRTTLDNCTPFAGTINWDIY